MYDLNKTLIDENGEPYKDEKGEIKNGKIILSALVNIQTNDTLKSYLLADRVKGSTEIDLGDDEINYIKGLLPKTNFIPYVSGQVITDLVNAQEEKKEAERRKKEAKNES